MFTDRGNTRPASSLGAAPDDARHPRLILVGRPPSLAQVRAIALNRGHSQELTPMIDNPIVSPALGLVIASNPVVLLDRRTRSSDWLRRHSVPQHSPGAAALLELARVVTITLGVIVGMLVTPRFAAAGGDPTDFIVILGNQGLEVIRSSATLDQKATYFHQVLRQDFDLSDMSRFVLVHIGELRARRNGANSAPSSKTILYAFMVSGLPNMAAKASG